MKHTIARVLFLFGAPASAMSGDLPDPGEPSPGRYELSKGLNADFR